MQLVKEHELCSELIIDALEVPSYMSALSALIKSCGTHVLDTAVQASVHDCEVVAPMNQPEAMAAGRSELGCHGARQGPSPRTRFPFLAMLGVPAMRCMQPLDLTVLTP